MCIEPVQRLQYSVLKTILKMMHTRKWGFVALRLVHPVFFMQGLLKDAEPLISNAEWDGKTFVFLA